MTVMRRPSPALIVACIALFVALGGTSYAVTALPRDSVGTVQLKDGAVSVGKLQNGSVSAAKIGTDAVGKRQLRNGSVLGAKIADNAITGAKVRDGSLEAADFKAGQLPEGPRGPAGATGATGAAGAAGTALAYASITTDPSLNTTFSSGVVGVTRPVTGVYCIELDASLQSLAFTTSGPQAGEPRRPAVATPEYAYSGVPSQVYVSNQSTGLCGSYRYQVRTFLTTGGFMSPTNSGAFNFVVP